MSRVLLLTAFIIIGLISGAAADSTGVLPPLDEDISITSWHVIGPFLGGPREPLANPLESAFHPLDSSGIPNLNARYPSTLATGRDVAWTEVLVDENGTLNVDFENVDWDKINDEWGVSGIYYSGAAYATFQSSKTCRALVNGHRIGSFTLNGVRYSGDPYGHRLIKTPVILEEGENHVMFFFGGFGGSKNCKFSFESPTSELMILDRDILLPDVIKGERLRSWAGIPVVNTTNHWIENATLYMESGDYLIPSDAIVPPLPPLCTIKVPIIFEVTEEFPDDFEEEILEIKIMTFPTEVSSEATAKARVRNPDDSRIITFRSAMDNSVQKYAVRYPLDYDPDSEYSLILSLHGAGVQCEGQVNSYQPKDWAFVVAATNRRRFGFDWQDWGREDAIEVYNQVTHNYRIDLNRVYLVGHSMGGHGTWHVGTTHADLFAAISPSAGWASFQLYMPWFLRRDELFADPDLKRILDACHSPDRTELLLENLRNTPVFAVHGADDDNVPPTHARLLTGQLERMGYDVGYWEVPGQGHWWDASPDIPGADCVDSDRIMNFLRNNERNPVPKHVNFVSYDLGNSNGMYWLWIEEEIKPMGRVAVDAEFIPGKLVRCTTQNVKRLTLDFSRWVDPAQLPGRIEIDGQLLEVMELVDGIDEPLSFIPMSRTDGVWRIGFPSTVGVTKEPDFRGPIKRAFFNPFLIVIGTIGTDEENALNLEVARNLSQRWWYRANGYARIVRDVEMDNFDAVKHNLVLIGGPRSNYVSQIVSRNVPIKLQTNGVWLGDEFIPGEDMAVKFVYPKMHSKGLILCNWGTSLEGTRLAGGLTCLYSGSGLPDFLIYDRDVRLKGYAGVKAMGFFDNEWMLDPDLYYISRN